MEDKSIHIDTINGDFCLNKYVYNDNKRCAYNNNNKNKNKNDNVNVNDNENKNKNDS